VVDGRGNPSVCIGSVAGRNASEIVVARGLFQRGQCDNLLANRVRNRNVFALITCTAVSIREGTTAKQPRLVTSNANKRERANKKASKAQRTGGGEAKRYFEKAAYRRLPPGLKLFTRDS